MSSVAKVIDAGPCDIHTATGRGYAQAKYDGKTVAGPWAKMCEDCFNSHGVGLGTGKGQLLEVMHCPECGYPVGMHRKTTLDPVPVVSACARTQMGAMSTP